MRGLSAAACALYLGEGGGQPSEDPPRHQGRDAPGRGVASSPAYRLVHTYFTILNAAEPEPPEAVTFRAVP